MMQPQEESSTDFHSMSEWHSHQNVNLVRAYKVLSLVVKLSFKLNCEFNFFSSFIQLKATIFIFHKPIQLHQKFLKDGHMAGADKNKI